MDEFLEKIIREKIQEDYPNASIIDMNYFNPSENDYEHKACCFCCEGNTFIQSLLKINTDYVIIRFSYTDYGRDCFVQSHEDMKNGTHPFSNYKKLIRGDITHPYNKFLIKHGIILNPNLFGLKAKKWQKNKEYVIVGKN